MIRTFRPFSIAFAGAFAVAALLPSTARAQGEFTPGTKVVSVGLLSDGGTGVGGAFEYSLLELAPKIRFGIGGSVGYFSEDVGSASFSSLPILATGNLHFALPEVPALDLFAGAALGIVRFSYDDDFPGSDEFDDTDTVFGINVGARYYFTPRVGGVAQLGLGDVPELFIGLSFKL
jgi:hypothetical protein